MTTCKEVGSLTMRHARREAAGSLFIRGGLRIVMPKQRIS